MSTPTPPPWPPHAALFLDLDGTLLEIAAHPDQAVPSLRLRELLPQLAPATEGAVAMISGRRIAELDRLLAPHRFPAAGIHGLERRRADGHDVGHETDEAQFEAVRTALEAFVAEHHGLLLEDKLFALALHYRLRPDLAPEVAKLAERLEADLPPGLAALRGKMVLEIKPSGTNKGSAIREFMSEPPFASRVPVFVGDDVTDEAGFTIVNELGGVAVKVGTPDVETAAAWRLEDVDAVLAWLETNVSSSLQARNSMRQ